MNNPKNSLPNGWSLKKLGEIAKIYVGRDLKEEAFSETYSEEYRFPVFSNTVENYGLYGFYNVSEYEGDSLTIVGRGAGLGTAFERKNCYGAIGRLLVVFPLEMAKSSYLVNYINSQINFFVESSGIPQLTGEQLTNYFVKLPPLPEQQKIATILGTWDAAIQTTSALLTALQKRKKALMQQLLSPKEKQMIEIGEIASELSIRNKNGYDFIVLSCTKYEGLVDSLKYFGRKIYSDDLSTYKIVPQNTFAYATNHIEEGSIGYQKNYPNALISPMYTVFKTNDLVDDSYLFFVLKSDRYIKIYQQNMSGSIDRRGALRWNDFAKLKIPLPPLIEQTRIAAILNAADAELRETEAYLEKLKTQKRGLMQQLLTGKVRVITT